jgi:hypothetical protein
MRKGRSRQEKRLLPRVNFDLRVVNLFQLTTAFMETLVLFKNIFVVFLSDFPVSCTCNGNRLGNLRVFLKYFEKFTWTAELLPSPCRFVQPGGGYWYTAGFALPCRD